MRQFVIHLHPQAPPKPASGQPCNGCGLCCAWAPCPLGIWLSRRRSGACVALEWDAAQRLYRCGAVRDPARYLRWLPPAWAARLARRWIAAARGCDATIERA